MSGLAEAAISMDQVSLHPSTKTPVSLLQELFVRKGMTPKYDLVQIEGAVHEPIFKYRVVVGDLSATGCGQSKKKAKHAAAKEILDKIRQATLAIAEKENGDISATTLSENDGLKKMGDPNALALCTTQSAAAAAAAALVVSPYDDGIEGNPVGELQELCMTRRVPPPTYDVGCEEGAAHERRFVMVCTAGGQKESGVAKSKKQAKRLAANKMLARLKAQPVEPDEKALQAAIDEDELVLGIVQMERKMGSRTNALVHKIYPFLLKDASRGPILDRMMRPNFDPESEANVVQLLDRLGEEQHIDVTFVDVEERSKRGKFHCLVQLSTHSTAVCFGVGITAEEAKINAAVNALLYITVMARKPNN